MDTQHESTETNMSLTYLCSQFAANEGRNIGVWFSYKHVQRSNNCVEDISFITKLFEYCLHPRLVLLKLSGTQNAN